MIRTSKSPKAVARVAYATAKQAVPLYRHLKSPKKFTQPQLIACLVLKEFFKNDYRGIVEILADSSDLRDILELKELPHYTTLQKAARRLTKNKTLDKLMDEIIDFAIKRKMMNKNVALSAVDGTGFESHHVSAYFVRRKAKGGKSFQETTYQRFPKVGILADAENYLILSGIPSIGPGADIVYWKAAICGALKRVVLKTLVADAGYDSEEAHRFAREDHSIRTLIPPRAGRPTTKLPRSKYRRIMATRFDKTLYGQRWQIETINSIIKRRLGSFLRARTYWSQMREIMLRLFIYNAMVV
jgi:IS5 family transposase